MALENSAYDFNELEEISNPYLHLEIPASKDRIGEIKINALTAIAETQAITKRRPSVILPEELIRETKLLKNAICEYFQIDEKSLFKETREQPIAKIRQIYMYLLKNLEPDLSYPTIAYLTGKKDHTTIIHACNKIAELYETDEKTKKDIDDILALYGGEKKLERPTIIKMPQIKDNVEEIKLLTLKKIVREAFRKYRYWCVMRFLDRFEECKSTIEFEKISENFLNELVKEETQAGLMGIEEIRKQQIKIFRNAMGLLDYALSEERKGETLAALDNEPQRAAQRLANALVKVSKTETRIPKPEIATAAAEKPAKEKKTTAESKTFSLLETGDSINPQKPMSDKEYMVLLNITLFFELKVSRDEERIRGVVSDLIEIREKLSKKFMKELRRFLRLAKQPLSRDDIKNFTTIIKEEMQLQKNKITHAEHL
ncbi:hypothetical protein HZA39_00945 [Candidatus Peregrinibacteria bacterium]|nr:hypothetical protein [Candidatus Peregrinibacteria bacterium]